MNAGTTQDENAGKTIRKRTAPMVLGALLLAQPFAFADWTGLNGNARTPRGRV